MPTPEPFDVLGFLMSFESGECDDFQMIEGFQHMIDTGSVWQLQGSYGRLATALIERGLCTPRSTP